MQPRRLEGLNSVFGNLRYERDKLITDSVRGVKSIRCAFKVTDGYHRNTVEANSKKDLVLGWDCVAKFEKTNEGFILKYIKILSGYENSSVLDKIYEQVVTRAVDTCTFVYLECGNQIVLAHFSSTKNDVVMEEIKKILPDTGENVTGICSYVKSEKNLNFYRKLLDSYANQAILPVIRDGLNDEAKYYGHFEIGIYLNDQNETELFGDVTRNPYSEEPAEATKLVSNRQDLINFRNM